MFDALPVLDALADGPPEAVAVRLRVVEGRGLAVQGARVTLELHRVGSGVGALPATAQAAIDRLEEHLMSGRALRLDWLDASGRPVASNGRPTYFRAASEGSMPTQTATRTTIIDQPSDSAPLTAAQLQAGERATGDPLVGPLLVALDRAQAQALQAAAEAQRFAQTMATDTMRALTDQTNAMRALAVANSGRDSNLIRQTIEAERRAADAEASAALAEAGAASGGGSGELGQLVDLVKSFRSGAPDLATVLPALLRKLDTPQGVAALKNAWGRLSEAERSKVSEALGAMLAGS
jgi:hypothetical protein